MNNIAFAIGLLAHVMAYLPSDREPMLMTNGALYGFPPNLVACQCYADGKTWPARQNGFSTLCLMADEPK
jgi:hypothetical protein